MKDYIKDYLPESEIPMVELRSASNPTGRDRANRLNRNFKRDISIVRDQQVNKLKHRIIDTGSSWDPHEYL